MNIALIMAGGNGVRMGVSTPKQFLTVYSKPIIIHTLEVFEKCIDIDYIVIVCLESWIDKLKEYICEYNITKCYAVVPGGVNSGESIKNGILYIKDNFKDSDIVVIHDGVRPNVSVECILSSIEKCKLYGSGVAAVPCQDSILETKDKVTSFNNYDRERLMILQTPQSFTLDKLFEVYTKENIDYTSTANLMVSLGEKIHFSLGSKLNLKITTKEDLEILKCLL